MNWFRHCGVGFHVRQWFELTLILLALCVALWKLVSWFFNRERDTDKAEKDYWRMHGGE